MTKPRYTVPTAVQEHWQTVIWPDLKAGVLCGQVTADELHSITDFNIRLHKFHERSAC